MIQQTLSNGSSLRLAAPPIEVLDFEPVAGDVRAEVIAGLSRPQKTLPCKLFYDERGSQLFDRICELPEYYPTRTELQILRDRAADIAAAVGPRAAIVEYGSGSSLKTRVLLDHCEDVAAYVPIDISRAHLLAAARAIATRYPDVVVRPVCADYTRAFSLPDLADLSPANTVAYFPGSTIGNFEPAQAVSFLRSMRETCGDDSHLLIGVDLKKDPAVLHAAYNDASGTTAAFNLNALAHLNREIGSDFDVAAFAHYAFYDPRAGRMEMHLVSRRDQHVSLGGGASVAFASGESIHTESCQKFTLASSARLADAAGYRQQAVWTDVDERFSVQWFAAVS